MLIAWLLTWEILYHFSNKIAKMYLDFTDARIVLVRLHFEIKSSTIHVFDKCWMQRHRVTFNNTWTEIWCNLFYKVPFHHARNCKPYLTAKVRFSAIFSNTFTNCNRNASRRRLRRIFSCFRSTASRMYITSSSIKSLFCEITMSFNWNFPFSVSLIQHILESIMINHPKCINSCITNVSHFAS